MFSLIEKSGMLSFARREAIPFALSLFIAEMFYKFGSFSLECISFLATWYAIGALIRFFKK